MTYKLIGQRNLRKYTEAKTSPTYAAAIEAQAIVDSLCGVPWKKVAAKDATMTYHTEETVDEVDGQKINGLDMNVRIRDQFDAALFCAGHSGGQHRAYANAAVYHYVLPDGTLPKLTKLAASVTSDPYNSAGARIAILTNATGEIPTNCNECRTGDAHADGVAPRTVAANGNWFPTMADCVFSATPGEGEVALPSGGLQLQKHLFVFVLMESYSTVRGNWLEGCSFIRNLVEIETNAAVPGWTDGQVVDLSNGGASFEMRVCKDGALPDYASQATGVKSLSVFADGTRFVPHEADIPSVDKGVYGRVSGVLSKIKGIDDGEVTCICPFSVAATSGTTRGCKMYVAIGGTFAGGSFTEIDGLYLYSVETDTLVEGVSLGDAVPGWMKNAAQKHGGFTVVISGSTTNPPNGDASKDNFFSCVFKDGFGIRAGAGDAGIAPLFWFGLSSFSDDLSFVASDGSWLIYPLSEPGLGMILNQGDAIVSASPFQSYSEGSSIMSSTGGTSWRTSCVLLVRNDAGYRIVFVYFDFKRSASTKQIYIGMTPVDLSDCGISGNVEAVGVLGCESFPESSDTYRSYAAAIVVSGDLGVNGVASNYAQLKFSCVINGGTGTQSGYEQFHSASVPDWASDLVPDVVGGLRASNAFPGGYVMQEMPLIGNALVYGGFSTLGGNRCAGAAVIDVANGEIVSADESFAGLAPRVALAFGDSVYAVTDGRGGFVAEWFDEHSEAVTDEQSVVGLRSLCLDFSRGKSIPVPASLTGRERVGAGFNVRKVSARYAIGVDARGDFVFGEAEVWRLTSSALALSFPLPTDFVARSVRMSWPAISATSGAVFSVWIREGAVDDFPDVSDVRLYDSKGQSVVGGWRLLGIVDASTTDRQAVFDLGEIRGRSATILLTAYVSPDLLNPSASTAFPIGAATSMDADMIGKTVSGLDSGWKPDITLID